jgi:hypothetical protein
MKLSTSNQSPVVRSLLENDLYKFTMWQALLHSHPGAQAEYQFVCRNATVFPLAELKGAVEAELTCAACISGKTNWTTCPACVSSRAISWISCRCSASSAVFSK